MCVGILYLSHHDIHTYFYFFSRDLFFFLEQLCLERFGFFIWFILVLSLTLMSFHVQSVDNDPFGNFSIHSLIASFLGTNP